MPKEQNTIMDYTARELLHKILEFHRMAPERAEWSMEAQRDNPPRLVRLKQIEALLASFGCGGTDLPDVGARIEAFLAGRFVMARRLEEYVGLLAEIEAATSKRVRRAPDYPFQLDDLRAHFAYLVRLRLKLEAVAKHNEGVLEVGYTRWYPVLVAEAVAKQLAEPIAELDRVLALFIDPAGRSFAEEDLVARFGFPIENLTDIDFDWL